MYTVLGLIVVEFVESCNLHLSEKLHGWPIARRRVLHPHLILEEILPIYTFLRGKKRERIVDVKATSCASHRGHGFTPPSDGSLPFFLALNNPSTLIRMEPVILHSKANPRYTRGYRGSTVAQAFVQEGTPRHSLFHLLNPVSPSPCVSSSPLPPR